MYKRQVLCLDDPGVREVSKDCQCPKIYYSVKRQDGDYTVRNISFAAGNTQADVYENNQFLGTLSLQVPGEHNVSNALGVIAAARWAGLNFPEIAAALETFSGAGRRFELLGEVRGSRVVDDYGHHPTEIAATLKAARQICKGRVICVFQPHRYTRTALLHERFGEAFGDAQEIIVTEIYSAEETPMEGISAKLIVEAIEKHEQRPVTYLPTLEAVSYTHLDVYKRQIPGGSLCK